MERNPCPPKKLLAMIIDYIDYIECAQPSKGGRPGPETVSKGGLEDRVQELLAENEKLKGEIERLKEVNEIWIFD